MHHSPLLIFAVQSCEEALEQYSKRTEKNRRFSILFCDQAIELTLKEKIRSIGESIYVKPGSAKTIDYHDMLNYLRNNKGIKIPEYPDLEMIHDLRNVIQHKGATVSEVEGSYYIKKTFEFIIRFLKEELQVNLFSLLDRNYYRILEPLVQVYINILEHVKLSESVDVKVKRRNVVWILPTYAELENELLKLSKRISLDPKLIPSEVVHELVKSKKISHPDSVKFNWLRKLRDQYAHTEKDVGGDEVEEFVNTALAFIEKIKTLNG